MINTSLRKGLSRFNLWIALLTVITMVGFYAIITGFLKGHEVTFNTSTGVPWGMLISAYIFFVVSSTGMCLVSSLGHVFGMKRFEPLAKRAILLAIVLMLSGFLVIASDLERPWLMVLYFFVTPNPTSAMWWMGALYGLYLVFMVVEFFFLCRADILQRLNFPSAAITAFHKAFLVGIREISPNTIKRNMKLARLSGAGGVISAIAAHSTLGAVFGFIGSRSIWHGPYLPIYFILSAFVSGSAILILSLVLSHKTRGQELTLEIKEVLQSLGQLLLLFLGIFLFFTIWKLVTAQYGRIPEEFESAMLLINGPLSVPFWVGEILLGILIPTVILVYTRAQRFWAVTAASLLVIVGMFAARYDFVVAGQLVPIIGRDGLWQYTPSVIETLSTLGALSLCLLLYSLGNRLFPLEDSTVTYEPPELIEARQPVSS